MQALAERISSGRASLEQHRQRESAHTSLHHRATIARAAAMAQLCDRASHVSAHSDGALGEGGGSGGSRARSRGGGGSGSGSGSGRGGAGRLSWDSAVSGSLSLARGRQRSTTPPISGRGGGSGGLSLSRGRQLSITQPISGRYGGGDRGQGWESRLASGRRQLSFSNV